MSRRLRVPPGFKVPCALDPSHEVDPNGYGVHQRVQGWEKPRDEGGANQITLREPLPEFACFKCIEQAKRGISPAQKTLLG